MPSGERQRTWRDCRWLIPRQMSPALMPNPADQGIWLLWPNRSQTKPVDGSTPCHYDVAAKAQDATNDSPETRNSSGKTYHGPSPCDRLAPPRLLRLSGRISR